MINTFTEELLAAKSLRRKEQHIHALMKIASIKRPLKAHLKTNPTAILEKLELVQTYQETIKCLSLNTTPPTLEKIESCNQQIDNLLESVSNELLKNTQQSPDLENVPYFLAMAYYTQFRNKAADDTSGLSKNTLLLGAQKALESTINPVQLKDIALYTKIIFKHLNIITRIQDPMILNATTSWLQKQAEIYFKKALTEQDNGMLSSTQKTDVDDKLRLIATNYFRMSVFCQKQRGQHQALTDRSLSTAIEALGKIQEKTGDDKDIEARFLIERSYLAIQRRKKIPITDSNYNQFLNQAITDITNALKVGFTNGDNFKEDVSTELVKKIKIIQTYISEQVKSLSNKIDGLKLSPHSVQELKDIILTIIPENYSSPATLKISSGASQPTFILDILRLKEAVNTLSHKKTSHILPDILNSSRKRKRTQDESENPQTKKVRAISNSPSKLDQNPRVLAESTTHSLPRKICYTS